MAKLGRSNIGISTFLASVHPADTCGTNGLPLTLNSIVVYGKFQRLKTLRHPNLCEYLDIVRGRHERLVIISEHYNVSLQSALLEGYFRDLDVMKRIAHEILLGLAYLQSQDIVHRSLSLDNILLDSTGKIKLSQYGRYYMTDCGTAVDFPIGSPRYLPPETLLQIPRFSSLASSSKVDTWSLGIIFTELFMGKEIWKDFRDVWDVKEIIKKTFSLMIKSKETNKSFLYLLLNDNGSIDILEMMPADLRSFIESCLTIKHSERPDPMKLLDHPLFEDIKTVEELCGIYDNDGFLGVFRSRDLELPVHLNEEKISDDLLQERSLQEVYHLWTLAGGDVVAELKKHNLIKSTPPVCSMPNVILQGGDKLGVNRDRNLLFDESVITLSLERVKEKLFRVEQTAYFPLLVEKDPCEFDSCEMKSLPVVIRERDVEYQFRRIVLFQRLLEGYPYTRDKILKEARIDIPPFLRAKVWAALLNVTGDVQRNYDIIDKESVTPTDRQIDVDIPRCHQYCELLASPTAHRKFKRVLKAWIVSNPGLVYWQGLDSLCAPFLSLSFSDEALAYNCLISFIPKYLYNFFLKDNSLVIQEYLAVFCHLIAFHDPELFNHLDEIGFQPELYAIPWFLTMFTQVDIERCVQDSIKIFESTPKSVAARQHENIPLSKHNNRTEKEFLPVQQIKSEKCPRISLQDMLHILDIRLQNKTDSSAKRSNKVSLKSWGIVVDIRPPEDYQKGHLPGSINMPSNQTFSENGTLIPGENSNTLQVSKGKIIIVVGGRANNCPKFAAELLKSNIQRVCVLDAGGMVTMRTNGLMTVRSV
ncbi:TBC domain-containing protein kinase-like protein isoform X2 [Xenia sp. Carnegie-2017]|uniref:TBC domain-containing protein kinase-like protein isoform X2 n=1 Tax=Xenia sp. Carnegie-2017 TaxID=2897299 RepID=UPI001F03D198|nr:TBC domain-containing protein kinase-like protein isoform X2 [Xenia sp. Carnegie-2017]